VRAALRCPDCGYGCRLVVVDGEVQGACLRCDVRCVVTCAACGALPTAELLTGLHDAACGCGAAFEPAPGPIRWPRPRSDDPLPDGDVDWRDVRVRERLPEDAYRSDRPAGLEVSRPKPTWTERATAWLAFGSPSFVLAAMGNPGSGVFWAGAVTAGLMYTQRRVVELTIDASTTRVVHDGWRRVERALPTGGIRRVFWAGQGARCALWAKTPERNELLFDHVPPDLARALEGRVARVLGR